jgi:hypothetical protein
LKQLPQPVELQLLLLLLRTLPWGLMNRLLLLLLGLLLLGVLLLLLLLGVLLLLLPCGLMNLLLLLRGGCCV